MQAEHRPACGATCFRPTMTRPSSEGGRGKAHGQSGTPAQSQVATRRGPPAHRTSQPSANGRVVLRVRLTGYDPLPTKLRPWVVDLCGQSWDAIPDWEYSRPSRWGGYPGSCFPGFYLYLQLGVHAISARAA